MYEFELGSKLFGLFFILAAIAFAMATDIARTASDLILTIIHTFGG